jgi:hypothetical protein
MDHVSGVKIFYRAKEVVNDGLDVLDLQMNRTFDNLLQVALSELEYHIEGVEVLMILRFDHVEDIDHVGVLELSEEIDLAQDTLAVNLIFENTIHLFDGDLLARGFVSRAAHGSI